MLGAPELKILHFIQRILSAPISWEEVEPLLTNSLQKIIGAVYFEIDYQLIDNENKKKVLYLKGPQPISENIYTYPAKQVNVLGLRLLAYFAPQTYALRHPHLNTKLKFIATRLQTYLRISYSLKTVRQDCLQQKNLYLHIKELEQKLSELNKEYEQKVQYIIDEEELILQNEKLNVLGEITPILAHEIKTPLSAMQGALLNFCNTFPSILRELAGYVHNLSPVENDLFWQLIDRIKDPNSKIARPEINEMIQEVNFTTRQQRRYVQEVRRELESLSLENAEELAEKFVKLGFTRDPSYFVSLFPQSFEKTIETLYGLAALWRQMQILKSASQKSQKIVRALNAYVGQPDAIVPVSVIETLEIVLTLYNYYLEQGIQLQTFWQELPPILANPQELIQVWTDLIMNAVYAMEGKGILKIKAVTSHNNICITFEDNGPPIEPEKIPYVFDPGIITRKGEEKVGIGLFNCKQVIQKHKGTLTVYSNTDGTCFVVTLPISANNLPRVTLSELKVLK
ncbi:MAG: ATP-binding protein [Bacteroidia bacterium]|nr:ATP-binding protein [Bacteroidia bacterium]MDW8159245.1 ATP-binding protein [Bacteroidia bacterium]